MIEIYLMVKRTKRKIHSKQIEKSIVKIYD